MNSTREGHGQDWDGIAEDASDRLNAGCRRRLLGGAAGGLALAISGLILPDWLEDAEARSGALGGAHGGRNGQNRRGRRHHSHKKRAHGNNHRKNRKKKQKPGASGVYLGIEFRVELISGRPIKVDLYHQHVCVGADHCDSSTRWEFIDRDTLAMPGQGLPTRTFSTESTYAALWINDRYLVRGSNAQWEVPDIEMGYGGEFINYTYLGWRNGTSLGTNHLKEGESAPAMQVDGYTVNAKRLDDDKTKKRKVFEVKIAAPAA